MAHPLQSTQSWRAKLLCSVYCSQAGHGISRLQKAVCEIDTAHLELFFLAAGWGEKEVILIVFFFFLSNPV